MELQAREGALRSKLQTWVSLKFEERLLVQEKDPIITQVREDKRLLRDRLQKILDHYQALSVQVQFDPAIVRASGDPSREGVWYIRYETHSRYQTIRPELVQQLVEKLFSRSYLVNLCERELKKTVVQEIPTSKSPFLQKMKKCVDERSLVAWLSSIFNELLTEAVVTRRHVPTVSKSKVRPTKAQSAPNDAEALAVNVPSIEPQDKHLAWKFLDQKTYNQSRYNQRVARLSDVRLLLRDLEAEIIEGWQEHWDDYEQPVQIACAKETFSYIVVLSTTQPEGHDERTAASDGANLYAETDDSPSGREPTSRLKIPGIKKVKDAFADVLPVLLREQCKNLEGINWTNFSQWLENSPADEHQQFLSAFLKQINHTIFGSPDTVNENRPLPPAAKSRSGSKSHRLLLLPQSQSKVDREVSSPRKRTREQMENGSPS